MKWGGDGMESYCMQNGATAVSEAAFKGHTSALEVLIRAGADVKTANKVRREGTERGAVGQMRRRA